jgi:hypothetical protein
MMMGLAFVQLVGDYYYYFPFDFLFDSTRFGRSVGGIFMGVKDGIFFFPTLLSSSKWRKKGEQKDKRHWKWNGTFRVCGRVSDDLSVPVRRPTVTPPPSIQ